MNSKTVKELKRIQESIPKELMDALIKTRDLTPDIRETAEKALEEDFVSEEKKEMIKNLLDSGELSRTEEYQDPDVAEKIDHYLSKEIDMSVKAGRLPDPKTDKDLINLKKKLWKKTKKNV